MRRRSLIIALIAVVFLNAFCYFNDSVIRQGHMVGSLMPTFVYGTLLLFLICINPLLKKWKFTGGELAVIVALVLIACGIPGWGMVRYLPNTLVLPHHDVRTRPGWAQENVIDMVPKGMLVDVREDESRILDGFVTGLSSSDTMIEVSQVPWGAWVRPLLLWIPLLLSITIALLGLAAVFHTQWSHHEQLPYPIAIFAHALLPEEGESRGSVFGNRLFLIGFLVTFLITLNNHLCQFWPEFLIPISLRFDFTPLTTHFETLVKGHGLVLFQPRINFMIMGLAYFLSSDVSLSLTVAPFIYCFIAGVLANHGISIRASRMMAPTLEPSIFAGGYCGIVLMLLYTGRHYYWNTLRKGLGLRTAEQNIEDHAVYGMRLFLIGTLLFVVQLVWLGVDWQLAIPYTFFLIMVHVAMSRMVVETGVFSIGTYVYPGVMLWAFMGASALGPRVLLILFLVSTILVSGPGWAPMPFIIQAFKFVDMSEVPVKRIAKWGMAILTISMFISIPTTIYFSYNYGAPSVGWPRSVVWFPFANTVEIIHKLRAQGLLEQASSVRGFGRLAHTSPQGPQVLAFAIAMSLAVLFALGRLRFTHWPLHPVVFLFLGGGAGCSNYLSFFLGWLIKAAVTKYGGARLYQQLKPMMIGVIAGPILAMFVRMVIGIACYYAGVSI